LLSLTLLLLDQRLNSDYSLTYTWNL
jgi:hypothetical protein